MPVEDDDLPEEGTPKKSKKKADPEPKKKPVAEVPAEPEPKKHVHTQRLIAAATELGFTQHDLDNHDSATIWDEIHRITTIAAEQARAKPVPEKKEPKPEVDDEEAYLASLEADGTVDPRFGKMLKRLLAANDVKEVKEKLGKLDKLEEAEKVRTARQQNEMVDTAFAALGKKFEALVGTDSIVETTDPGQRGWKLEIFRQAQVDFAKDSQRTINKKIAEVAARLAKGKVSEEDDEEVAAGYEQSAKKKPAKDPTSGRFTKEQFEEAALAAPGRKTNPDELSAVEKVRQHFRENGDPRGFRPNSTDDMDDLPE